MMPILVTTEYRGVFYGLVPEDCDLSQRTLSLMGARCAIRFGTTRGVVQLAETGPTNKSKIGARADMLAVHGITGVWRVTPDAQKVWEES
jgi:hypothetical protein